MLHIIGLSVLTFTAVVSSPEPQVAPPPRPSFYYPTTVGDTWVMKWKFGEQRGHVRFADTHTYKVTATRDEGGEKVVTVSQSWPSADQPEPHERVRVSNAGIVSHSWDGRAYGLPYRMLVVPFRQGDEWTVCVGRRDWFGWYKCVGRVGAVEEVRVPAGVFKAVRVDYDWTFYNQEPHRYTIWYAPRVGEVKHQRDGFEAEMQSFTPGSK